MSERRRTPTVLFSNANLAQTVDVRKSPHHPIISPRAVGKFATKVGCDGVDWQPLYPTVPGSAEAVALAVKKGYIRQLAQHQSFNEDPYKTELVGLQQHVLASKIGQKMIVPGSRESVGYMADVQRRVGKKMPAVYYPQQRVEDNLRMLKEGEASMSLFQPMAQHLELWDVDSAEGLLEEAARRELETCFDTHHGQRGGKFGLLLAGSASTARAIHLSVARYDMPDPFVDIEQDVEIARTGNYTGAIGDTFDAVDELGDLDYVVLEAPIAGLRQATGYTAMRDIVQVYAEVVDGIRDRYA